MEELDEKRLVIDGLEVAASLSAELAPLKFSKQGQREQMELANVMELETAAKRSVRETVGSERLWLAVQYSKRPARYCQHRH